MTNANLQRQHLSWLRTRSRIVRQPLSVSGYNSRNPRTTSSLPPAPLASARPHVTGRPAMSQAFRPCARPEKPHPSAIPSGLLSTASTAMRSYDPAGRASDHARGPQRRPRRASGSCMTSVAHRPRAGWRIVRPPTERPCRGLGSNAGAPRPSHS